MFEVFKKKTKGATAKFQITGMHCTSCSMNIDGALEDTNGVMSASTSYAKAETTIEYDPAKVTPEKLQAVIEALDYSAKLL